MYTLMLTAPPWIFNLLFFVPEQQAYKYVRLQVITVIPGQQVSPALTVPPQLSVLP
jgi:hypothetical protein